MDLFDQPESLSPMEEWRQRHKVGLYKTLDGWKASTAEKTVHGTSQEDALLKWADKTATKCWKAEEIESLRKK